MPQTKSIKSPTSQMRATEHHVSVTLTVYEPKTVTTEYIVEQGTFERIAHDVQYAHRANEWDSSVLRQLSMYASAIRVGSEFTKFRFDMMDVLDVYHQHNQAEQALDESIFSDTTITDKAVKPQWVVTKVVYMASLLEISQRPMATSPYAYGSADLDALTMLPDTLPEYTEGAFTIQAVCQQLNQLKTNKLVGGHTNYVLNCLIQELKQKKFKPQPHEVLEK